jgi:hypothetical protein
MKTSRFSLSGRLVLALTLAALGGCATLQYRAVQSQFEQAVRADNDQSELPFTDTASRYLAVANELTPAYIANLDEKLQPNAWTLRAVSEWRAGQFTNALQSANDGLNAIGQLKQKAPNFEASRDSIVLTMIPGLVEDSRLRQRLKEQGAPDVAAHYDDYAGKFHNALRSLAEAKEKMTPVTPGSVRYYWYFQCWRVLENWQFVLGKLPLDRQAEANKAADEFLKATLGGKDFLDASTLPTAVANAENGIPANHVYRKLIDLERQR